MNQTTKKKACRLFPPVEFLFPLFVKKNSPFSELKVFTGPVRDPGPGNHFPCWNFKGCWLQYFVDFYHCYDSILICVSLICTLISLSISLCIFMSNKLFLKKGWLEWKSLRISYVSISFLWTSNQHLAVAAASKWLFTCCENLRTQALANSTGNAKISVLPVAILWALSPSVPHQKRQSSWLYAWCHADIIVNLLQVHAT